MISTMQGRESLALLTMSKSVLHRAVGGGVETGGGVGVMTGGGVGQVLGSRYMVWRGRTLMRPKIITVRLACKQTGT